MGPILLNYLLAVSKEKKKKTSSTAGILMKTSSNTPDRRQNQVSQTFFSSYKGQIFRIFVILTYKRIQLEANTSLIISGISLLVNKIKKCLINSHVSVKDLSAQPISQLGTPRGLKSVLSQDKM